MDYLTVILVSAAALGFTALVWLAGYELGTQEGASSERALANQRINGILAGERRIGAVIDYENRRKPSRKSRIKAQRKAVRA